ncbi:MAG: lysophospholipid acyltransferase family protein [Formosimonas sp.]
MWVKWLLQVLSKVPLPMLHAVGGFFGRMVYRWDKKYRARLQANATQAGFDSPQFWREAAAQMGCGVIELAHLWTARVNDILPRVKVTGWGEVQAAQARGRGVLMLTPHVGAFELLSLWIGHKARFTAMYRPPKQAFLSDIMLTGRQKFNVNMASADIKGIRTMLRALKNNELVGLLPDQVPNSRGEAVVAQVFGAPALTMTLPAKLLKQTDAALVVMSARRVQAAHGFEIDFKVVDFTVTDDAAHDATRINDLMAQVIMHAPEQYLWGYNRYKNIGQHHVGR